MIFHMFTISTCVSGHVSFPSPLKRLRGYYDLRGKCYTPMWNVECYDWGCLAGMMKVARGAMRSAKAPSVHQFRPTNKEYRHRLPNPHI